MSEALRDCGVPTLLVMTKDDGILDKGIDRRSPFEQEEQGW